MEERFNRIDPCSFKGKKVIIDVGKLSYLIVTVTVICRRLVSKIW